MIRRKIVYLREGPIKLNVLKPEGCKQVVEVTEWTMSRY